MKLQVRTILMPSIFAGVLALTVCLLLNKVTVEVFSQIERGTLARQAERVDNALENVVREHALKLGDWAQWDNTFQFMDTLDPAYISETLNPLTLSALHFTSVIYLTPEATSRYAVTVDAQGEVHQSSGADITAVQSLLHDGPNSSFQGFVRLGDQVFIVAGAPILPNKGDQPSRGTIVAAAVVDQALLDRVAYDTNLKISFENAWSSNWSPDGIRLPSSDSAQVFGTVKALTGNPLIRYRIDGDRPVVSAGRQVRNFMALILASTAVVLALFLIHVINGMILINLSRTAVLSTAKRILASIHSARWSTATFSSLTPQVSSQRLYLLMKRSPL